MQELEQTKAEGNIQVFKDIDNMTFENQWTEQCPLSYQKTRCSSDFDGKKTFWSVNEPGELDPLVSSGLIVMCEYDHCHDNETELILRQGSEGLKKDAVISGLSDGNSDADSVDRSNISTKGGPKQSRSVKLEDEDMAQVSVKVTDSMESVELEAVARICEFEGNKGVSIDENSVLKINQAEHEPMFGDGGSISSEPIPPPSELIAYSGPLPHCGSGSFRSISSTTSAQSFAFPALQQEWSSSPVRMPAAETRGTSKCQKKKWWKIGTLCCEF